MIVIHFSDVFGFSLSRNLSFIYRNESLRNPFRGYTVRIECHCENIEETLWISQTLPGFQILGGGPDNTSLLYRSHTLLRGSLNGKTPGLDLHKMYSTDIRTYDVNFKMTTSEIPLQNDMSPLLEEVASDVLARLS